MKAKEILEWICRESICGEYLNTIDITEEECQDEEYWINTFGMSPAAPIPAGRYLYYYLTNVCDRIIINGKDFEPDAEIELPNEDNMWGCDYIYLYKIED